MSQHKYQFEPYDVLQISRDRGQTWEDYTTLRTATDCGRACGMVDRDRNATHHDIRYRITRGQVPIYF